MISREFTRSVFPSQQAPSFRRAPSEALCKRSYSRIGRKQSRCTSTARRVQGNGRGGETWGAVPPRRMVRASEETRIPPQEAQKGRNWKARRQQLLPDLFDALQFAHDFLLISHAELPPASSRFKSPEKMHKMLRKGKQRVGGKESKGRDGGKAHTKDTI